MRRMSLSVRLNWAEVCRVEICMRSKIVFPVDGKALLSSVCSVVLLVFLFSEL